MDRTISKSLNVTSSAKVFLTPMVPHRVGLMRRDENDPSLHVAAFELQPKRRPLPLCTLAQVRDVLKDSRPHS